MLKLIIILPIFLLFATKALAQQICLLTTGRPVSLRGLSVVNDRVIWVSGSGGTVGRSIDSGKTWIWNTVNQYKKTDFRDIEAFSEMEAVVMGITEPAVILRTTDGGKSWTKTFEDSSKSCFLDAMDFSGENGIAVGDPLKGKIFFTETANRGATWYTKIPSGFDTTSAGESFFAASGTNCLIKKEINNSDFLSYFLVSGGKKSCLYISSGPGHPGLRFPLLLDQGGETMGANSIAINPYHADKAVIVGGDFSHDTSRYRNAVLIQLYPFRQRLPDIPPHGYRSCVEYINNTQLICCGTSGVDFSDDSGLRWKQISGLSLHVCKKAPAGTIVYLAGAGGTVARLQF